MGQLRDANKTLITEHNVFLSKIKVLQEELDSVKGEKVTDPVLPAGLKGRILVVDPKWDFVIAELNKTESEGVQKNGVLLVSRNGKLVAKVRIASTQNNRCIANVMPGWKLDELMEGDLVIY